MGTVIVCQSGGRKKTPPAQRLKEFKMIFSIAGCARWDVGRENRPHASLSAGPLGRLGLVGFLLGLVCLCLRSLIVGGFLGVVLSLGICCLF